MRQRSINFYICDEIPKILDRHGFTDIRNEEKIISYGKNGGIIGDMSIKSFTSIISALKCSLSEFTSINTEEFDNLSPSLIEEVNERDCKFKMYKFFAQKPLANYIS
jgi:hypothetical protein